MAIFNLGVSVFGLMTLTDKVVLLSIKAADGPAQFAERVVWCRLLIKLSPNEIKSNASKLKTRQ